MSQDSENDIFYLRHLEMLNMHLNIWRHHRYQSLTIAQPKTKILLWNFVLMFACTSVTYVSFFDNLKNLDFIGNHYWKNDILIFWSQHRNILKRNMRWPVCRSFNFTPFGIFRFRLTLNLNILAVFKHLPLFYPK